MRAAVQDPRDWHAACLAEQTTQGTPMLRALTILALACPALASANVMTFDEIPFYNTTGTWVEDGITASGSTVGWWQVPGSAQIERLGSAFGSSIDFTMDTGFTPGTVDILFIRSDQCLSVEACFDGPVPYVWFSGFVGDALVSTFGIYRPASTEFATINLSFLGEIDMLRIEAKRFSDLGIAVGYCGTSCGLFKVDNLALTPTSVPEPGTLSLFGVGMAGLLAARKRRTRTLV